MTKGPSEKNHAERARTNEEGRGALGRSLGSGSKNWPPSTHARFAYTSAGEEGYDYVAAPKACLFLSLSAEQKKPGRRASRRAANWVTPRPIHYSWRAAKRASLPGHCPGGAAAAERARTLAPLRQNAISGRAILLTRCPPPQRDEWNGRRNRDKEKIMLSDETESPLRYSRPEPDTCGAGNDTAG